MIKVCLDTNIIISAIIFGGKYGEVFNLIIECKLESVTSLFILSEVAKVLDRKFERSESEIKEAISLLADVSQIVDPKVKVGAVSYKPDNEVVRCAVSGEVNYLVTGDKNHLLKLGEYKGVKIVSPKDFLDLVAVD